MFKTNNYKIKLLNIIEELIPFADDKNSLYNEISELENKLKFHKKTNTLHSERILHEKIIGILEDYVCRLKFNNNQGINPRITKGDLKIVFQEEFQELSKPLYSVNYPEMYGTKKYTGQLVLGTKPGFEHRPYK